MSAQTQEKKESQKAQFIGPRQVSSVVTSKHTTPKGEEIVTILYEGGHTETMPKRTFDIVVTTEATDWNALQRRKHLPIVQDILDIVMEYDVKADEIDALLRSVGIEVDNAFNRAVSYLWTGDDSYFTPGINPMMERTLLEAVSITKDVGKKDSPEDEGDEQNSKDIPKEQK